MQWQVNPRGDVPLANSSRWPYLRGGADACFDSRYAACACGKNPRRGPPAALPEADVHRRCLVRWRAFPCAARHAAMDDQIFASLWLRKKKLVGEVGRALSLLLTPRAWAAAESLGGT
jgi:hypothetical protein